MRVRACDRRALLVVERSPGFRQDHAHAAYAGDTVSSQQGGAHRGDQGAQRGRRGKRLPAGQQAAPGAAPHHLDRRPGGWGEQPEARRSLAGAPGRAVSRRVPGVRAEDPRGLAPAARRRPRNYLAGGGDPQLPGEGEAGLLDEPVPVRVRGRCQEGLPVHPWPDRTLPGPHLGATHRQDGPLRGRAAPHPRRASRWANGRTLAGGP